MTDEERAEAVLENIRRRDELRHDIQILEQKLKNAGRAIERLGRALSENPSDVRQSVRELDFELPRGEIITLHCDDLRRAVVGLKEAHDELFSVNGNCPGSRWPSGWIGRTGSFCRFDGLNA